MGLKLKRTRRHQPVGPPRADTLVEFLKSNIPLSLQKKPDWWQITILPMEDAEFVNTLAWSCVQNGGSALLIPRRLAVPVDSTLY